MHSIFTLTYSQMLLYILIQMPFQLWLILKLFLTAKLNKLAPKLLILWQLWWFKLAVHQMHLNVQRGQFFHATSHNVRTFGTLLVDLPSGEIVRKYVLLLFQFHIVNRTSRFSPTTNELFT